MSFTEESLSRIISDAVEAAVVPAIHRAVEAVLAERGASAAAATATSPQFNLTVEEGGR